MKKWECFEQMAAEAEAQGNKERAAKLKEKAGAAIEAAKGAGVEGIPAKPARKMTAKITAADKPPAEDGEDR